MEAQNYTATWLAEWLHSWPRLMISQGFMETNSTFAPDDYDYLEALTFWGAIPIAFLFLSLLFFLVYFCCWCCCCRHPKPKRRIPCLKCFLLLFTVLCLVALAVGFYGNQLMNTGVSDVADAAENANETIVKVETQVSIIDRTLSDDLTQSLEDLKGTFSLPISNVTVQEKLQELTSAMILYVEEAADSVVEVKQEIEKINVEFNEVASMIRHYEFLRWLVTIIVLCWEAIVCLLVFLGVCRSSRCVLFLVAALGLITLIICWTALGVKLFVSLGTSDFCVSPDVYITDQTAEFPLGEDVVEYYVYCYPDTDNPFQNPLKDGQTNLDLTQTNIHKVEKLAALYYPKAMSTVHVIVRGLNQTEAAIHQVAALVDCDVLHSEYMRAVTGVCYCALDGLALLLVSIAGAGFLFGLMVLVASCAWRRLATKKNYYKVEKTDGLYPKPQSDATPYLDAYYSHNTTMPAILRSPDPEVSSISTGRGSVEIAQRANQYTGGPTTQQLPNGEQTLPLIRGSPPPAYHPVTVDHTPPPPTSIPPNPYDEYTVDQYRQICIH
uniref:Protein tweety homolog n=1 Tax=Saccoglossus kowalevskii TaxID=10224 RepID=A0ABM0M3S1_SACKO|nr:PREDICTED: protein tweety homolog 3-like isoform X2 [Saccoglossus kowalevskii]